MMEQFSFSSRLAQEKDFLEKEIIFTEKTLKKSFTKPFTGVNMVNVRGTKAKNRSRSLVDCTLTSLKERKL